MTELHRYEVLEVVGSGGMATVWRAHDRELERVVALKRPHPAPRGSDVHARFDREARMAAAVSHPNLIEVFDAGRDADGPYLVMELVDAPSLTEARLGPEDAARIGAEVAAGLAALHAVGIVHRDVKPANVLLSDDGAKLTDFGIARPLDTTTLTQPGLTHGTPAYAAPEVLTEGAHSPASDVYALAMVVFELVTGSRSRADTDALLDESWRLILEPALATNVDERPTAAEFGTVLRRAAEGTMAGLPPTQPIAIAGVARGGPDVPTRAMATSETEAAEGTRREVRTAVVAFGVLAAVTALVIAAATRADSGDVSAEPQAAASTSVANRSTTTTPTSTPTSTPTTTPDTTMPPDTTTSSASAPTTRPSVSSLPTTPEDTMATLLGLVDESGVIDSRKPRSRFEKHLDRAIDRAEKGRDEKSIADQLRSAAREIVQQVAGTDERGEIMVLMRLLAEQLGVDTDVVTDELTTPV